MHAYFADPKYLNVKYTMGIGSNKLTCYFMPTKFCANITVAIWQMQNASTLLACYFILTKFYANIV